jgi:hypothetical protein
MRNICFVNDRAESKFKYMKLLNIHFKYQKFMWAILTTIMPTIVSASDGDWTDLSIESYRVFSRATTPATNTEILKNLPSILRELYSHPLLSARLPREFALLIDGEWKLSAGYWSPALKGPSGESALLVTPQALLFHAQNKNLIAHELVHLVHYNRRPHEENWVQEGVALLAEYLISGTYNSALREAFAEPETSLVASLNPHSLSQLQPLSHPQSHDKSLENSRSRAAQYGHLLQYFYYLYTNCGAAPLLTQLLDSDSKASGIAFLDEVLRSLNPKSEVCANFAASFRAFSLARFLQSPYARTDNIMVTSLRSQVRDQARALPPYSAGAYQLNAGAKCAPSDYAWGSSRCIRIRLE